MNALLKELLQMPEARALLDSTCAATSPWSPAYPRPPGCAGGAVFQETGRPMLLLCSDLNGGRAAVRRPLPALTGVDVTLLRRRDWQSAAQRRANTPQ